MLAFIAVFDRGCLNFVEDVGRLRAVDQRLDHMCQTGVKLRLQAHQALPLQLDYRLERPDFDVHLRPVELQLLLHHLLLDAAFHAARRRVVCRAAPIHHV